MRCKACNKLMADAEITQYKEDDTPEDLCGSCKSASNSEYSYTSDHVYIGDSFPEGLNPPSFHRE